MEYNINDCYDMNEDVAIQIKNLIVRYRVPDEKISGIKEYVDKVISRKLHHKEFVALNNLNLTIKKGERVGIIGHNGAGKSTLLKVIAKVIKPSEGELEVNGTIAPLLELGAGFDLELTGVQNIYLNGAILGKSKKYLNMVEEDIIEFAELGEFINYPVKNYSSGMRAKLGFAIASQVDSDILLVDEVFGVGDENFKRKSKAKMVEMINSGKTVIIVSHDMTQMVDLTERVIWMNNGEVVADGPPQEVCDKYCAYMLEHQNVIVENRKARTLITKVNRKKRSEEEKKAGEKNKVVRLAKKIGIWDKLLNDSLSVKELLYDDRVLRRLPKDEVIVERVLESEHALQCILENESLLNEVLQSDVVKEEIGNNQYCQMSLEKKPGKTWGDIDECTYYKEAGVLYIKGWYMPVEAYTDVKIYMAEECLGDAQLRLVRNGASGVSSNPLDRFSGWEFVAEVSLLCEEIEAVIFYDDKIVSKKVVPIVMTEETAFSAILWKARNNYSVGECWRLYQKYVLSGFNMLSYKTKNCYNEMLENVADIGWLYKKNYIADEREIGFELVTNHLGLRGPADANASNIVIGAGDGLSFGVDEDKTWYADKTFQKDWLNLSYACEPNQLQRIISKYVKKKRSSKRAIILYEASFWSIGISKEIKAEKDKIPLGIDDDFRNEKVSFYEFFNKVYEGVFRVVQGTEEKLLNSQYAKFDFKKNAVKCDYVTQKWKSILEDFDQVIVFRIPNKEYLYADLTNDDMFGKLKDNQDYGWELFKAGLNEIGKIQFCEKNDFELSDYFYASSYLNVKGNEKLKKWIIKNI